MTESFVRAHARHKGLQLATVLRATRLSKTNLWIVGVVVLGAALRFWILAEPRLGKLDPDESVAGLMALHFSEGEFAAFFWGQSYGGTAEVALTAILFKVFGFSVFLPKVITIGLHAVGSWLTWRVGIRLFDRNTAAVAAALAWVWPTFAVWKSNRFMGFYALGLVLVMLILLLVVRNAEAPRRSELFLLGVVVGLGWWTHPTVIFAAIPAAIWLLFRRSELLQSSPLVLTGAAVGSLPWLWSNVASDWNSVGTVTLVDSFGQYLDALWGLLVQPLPAALGLRLTGSPLWVIGPALGIAVYIAILVGIAWPWRAREPTSSRGLLLAVALGYLLILAISWHSLYRAEPRYLYIVMPVLALLVADLARKSRTGLALPSLLVVLSIVGLFMMSQFPKDPWVPVDFNPLVATLHDEGIDRVFAYHTIAYRLTFETEEEIIATAIDNTRYLPFDEAVRASADAAYVFAPMPDVAQRFQDQLEDAGSEYSVLTSGEFTIVIPKPTVMPDEFDSLRPERTN